MPLCLCVVRACWGGLWGVSGHWVRAQWRTFFLLQRAVVVSGRLCVVGAPGPSSEAWVPYHKAAGVVCGSGDLRLPPTTEPQRGARGVWSEALLDSP